MIKIVRKFDDENIEDAFEPRWIEDHIDNSTGDLVHGHMTSREVSRKKGTLRSKEYVHGKSLLEKWLWTCGR